MKRALLDINVLLAMLDSDHVDHERARDWINTEIRHGWASCAITQNGFVRIISQPHYPSPVPPGLAVERLARASNTEYHEFWPCSVSLLDEHAIDRSRQVGPRQVTDAYLLALAARHDGRLATFDRSIPLDAAHGAREANLTVLWLTSFGEAQSRWLRAMRTSARGHRRGARRWPRRSARGRGLDLQDRLDLVHVQPRGQPVVPDLEHVRAEVGQVVRSLASDPGWSGSRQPRARLVGR